jgi:hypothetical protein
LDRNAWREGATVKYVFLMYGKEGVWPEDEHKLAVEESVAVCHALHRKGQYLRAAPLLPPSTATTISIRGNKRLVTKGPFAETTEQLGGYFLVDLGDLDEAIAVAAQIPGSRRGTAEIRPLSEWRIAASPRETGTEFLLSVFAPESLGAAEERQRLEETTVAWDQLETEGYLVAAALLPPVQLATSVRVRDQRRQISDGPYELATPPLVGFVIVRVEHRNDALSLSTRLPDAKRGSIEVREVMKLDTLP